MGFLAFRGGFFPEGSGFEHHFDVEEVRVAVGEDAGGEADGAALFAGGAFEGGGLFEEVGAEVEDA